MATARPPGGGTPTARLELDLSAFRNAPAIAREAGRATEREISNAFKSLRAEQKLAQTQANTTLAAIRAQQAQITATTRAESAQRMAVARAEAATQAQVARASAATTIEEERRKTAAFKTELRERERANRQSQVSSGSFGRSAATFAGAALGGPIGGLAGALSGGSLPLAAGLAVSGAARFAIEGEQLATSYNRQRVAAVSLAGSQARLNELMETYRRAVGGAAYNADALADVTKLMGVGFADDAKELDQFTRAIRGIALAMKTTEDTVTQNLVLELFSQRGQRLDQLGLQYDKVRARADELRAADASLSQQQAYQNAVLEQAQQRYGALTDSVEGQKTGVERLGVAWKNFRLELGQDSQGPVNDVAGAIADAMERASTKARIQEETRNRALTDPTYKPGINASEAERQTYEATRAGQESEKAIQVFWAYVSREFLRQAYGVQPSIGPQFRDRPPAWMTSATPSAMPVAPAPRFDADQTAALRRREEGFAEIERQAAESRLDATRDYERQRTSTIINYEKSIAREAQDFARQRLNAERKFALSLLEVAQDSARQRVKWEEELARNIAQAQADSAERVAELREDSSKRLVESEEKYAEDREKRQRAHQKTLREAAANLDAVAVREEQRRYRDEAKEAKDAHEEQKQDIQEQLNERLDDEAKSLAKSIAQSRETNQRRVEEQAENDRLHIEEMKAAFEAQKVEEDAQRAIQLERRAEDHAAQLAEMATAQAERIQQIKDHAQEERDQFTEESNAFLEEVGIHNQAWLDEQEKINKGVIRRHEELLEAQRRALLNPMGQTPAFPSLANPYQYVPPVPIVPSGGVSTSSRSVTMGDLHLTIIGGANMSRNEFRDAVYDVLVDLTEDD